MEYLFSYKGKSQGVPSRKRLLALRNLGDGRVLVVYHEGETLRVDLGEPQRAMGTTTIQFSPTHLSQDPCDGMVLGNDTIPMSIVDQLIVSKLGG
jgi:hypothetical protein